MHGLVELAGLARARKAARFAEVHKREIADVLAQATAPLNERIVELEGLLANAVENGDRLAKELDRSEARAKALEARAEKAEARAEKAEAKAATAKVAPKRGK